ncbi:MAG: hypothetical protein JST11_00595 [Acidobacteria bacterium]|nr:hypothetical protein [Acidobacteriota bacterium]
MRKLTALGLLFVAACAAGGERKEPNGSSTARPAGGVRTPGIQIPFASLQSDLTFEMDAPAKWIAVTDALWLPAKDSLLRIDPKSKESKFGDPVTGLNQPCAGVVSAFKSLWAPDCGSGGIARIDPKSGKVTAMLAFGAYAARPGIAADSDSVWVLADDRGTLVRIDPAQNLVVAGLRVSPDCGSLLNAASALWMACPAENKIVRIDPETNVATKTIDVSARPSALVFGEDALWVLCEKEGKIDRVDPKTGKVTHTIELGAPAAGGSLAIGEGSLWVSMPGFPITRIDPASEAVVQQFFGAGAGAIQATSGGVWLADSRTGKLREFDPRRIAATLAE